MNSHPVLPISKVDFSVPDLRRAVALMGADNKCSYLLALAAWQRGLMIEFYGSQADARVNHANMTRSSTRPELYWITDGRQRYFFNRSMGEKTSPATSDLAKDKDAAKKRFLAAGVTTPDYVLWQGANIAEVRNFLERYPDKTFVLKPVVGSLRVGVQMRVPGAQVLQRLSNLGAVATLVEVQIVGLEHRVYVVGNQAVAANAKPGVWVVGNGRDSIAQLIGHKNAQRAANPVLASCQIDLSAAVQYLAEFGQTASRVPVFGEKVILSASNNMGDGGDGYSVIGSLEPVVTRMAVAACAAIGIPNGGMDIIFDGTNAYVLELNARAQIGGHSFPTVGVGPGNVVAEAIVDWYFPTPDGSAPQRHAQILDNTGLLAAFDKTGAKTRFKISPLSA
jgi:D-alanine-D-alanine ligase-like ATP-grasp enzyme